MKRHKRKKGHGRRRHHRRVHHRRRRNPGMGGGKLGLVKVLTYVGIGAVSGAVAFALPEVVSFFSSGAKAYIPAAALVAGGAYVARKNPLLGASIAIGAGAGAAAPLIASHIVPATNPSTSSVDEMGALGPRLAADRRLAAVIEAVIERRGIGALYPHADMLTAGR